MQGYSLGFRVNISSLQADEKEKKFICRDDYYLFQPEALVKPHFQLIQLKGECGMPDDETFPTNSEAVSQGLIGLICALKKENPQLLTLTDNKL